MFHDRARIHVRRGAAGTARCRSGARSACPRADRTVGTAAKGETSSLIADPDLRDLSRFRRDRRFRAGRGGHGGGANKPGADGETRRICGVPVGTQVFDEDGTTPRRPAPAGARVVVARGRRRRPREQALRLSNAADAALRRDGAPGEERALELRLKLLADAALVGLPNAGKSSLLRRISNAQPKVAEYPFTTLEPVLGTVDAPDGRQLTVADVPGLIEGASEGVGLGHEFLAHLERARMLVHVIDAAADDPVEQFRVVDRELFAYGAGLGELPQIVVLNKIDLLPDPPSPSCTIRASSASSRCRARPGGVDGVPRGALRARPGAAERDRPTTVSPTSSSIAPRRSARPFRIFRTDRGFRITGTPPEGEELEEALKAAGARKGAEVEIGDEVSSRRDRALRRSVRPAAQRPRCARSRRLGATRARSLRRPRRGTAGTQAGARTGGRPPRGWPARRFRECEIELDVCVTVDMLRAREWDDPSSSSARTSWRDFRVVEGARSRARAGSARRGTRPGYLVAPQEPVDVFDHPAASTCRRVEVRRRVAEGEAVDESSAAAVAALIEELGVYVGPGYTDRRTLETDLKKL